MSILMRTSAIALIAFSMPAIAQEIVTITDDLNREVEIPADPQTVVITGGEEITSMLTSLGFVPTGMAWGYHPRVVQTLTGIGGYVGDLSDVTIVGSTQELDYETIATLTPDLIIEWAQDASELDKLVQLAPTVSFNPRFNTFGPDAAAGGDRYAKQRVVASLVGLESALEQQIAEYETMLDAVRARHANTLPNLEWTFLDTADDFSPHMYDSIKYFTYSYNAVMSDLGLKESDAMNAATRSAMGYDEDFGYAQISLELVPDFAADLIFVGRYDDAPLAPDLTLVLQSTQAADADQIYRVDSNAWTYHLVQSQINILNEVDEILSEGVENLGDF